MVQFMTLCHKLELFGSHLAFRMLARPVSPGPADGAGEGPGLKLLCNVREWARGSL